MQDQLLTKKKSKIENRLLFDEINKNFKIILLPWILTTDVKKIRLLEIGSGDGKYGFYISNYVNKYIGVDVRENSVKEANVLLK